MVPTIGGSPVKFKAKGWRLGHGSPSRILLREVRAPGFTRIKPALESQPLLCEHRTQRRTGVMALKVLVVDDDPIMHRVLKLYLERNGYQMITANNGREGLVLAAREQPNFIVLDVRMPEMGGLAALRQLKEMESTKAIPVIVVTVHADRLTQMESQISGSAVFLAKPFRPGDLLAELQRLAPLETEGKHKPSTGEPQK
jgi:CheY-like chemotaxis protein